MKVKEYEMYKAVYCSLCREIGKNYGVLARFTLSYDFTFLALLNLSMEDVNLCIERKHCPFNPLKKCNFCKNSSFFDMPSAAAMIMIYYKMADNVVDEKGIKKWFYKLLKFYFGFARKKAMQKYPQIEEIFAEYITNQNNLENENCSLLDEAANPTALALGKLFSLCSSDSIQERILDRIGYCVGRYIYILDAASDLSDDLKSGSYNVLKNGYDKQRIENQLYFCINEACKAFELLDIKRNKTILGNILYLGLEETFKTELSENGEKK